MPVSRRSFPLADSLMTGVLCEQHRPQVPGRNVIDRSPGCFKQSLCLAGLPNDLSIQLHANMFCHVLGPRRARIVPHAFLSRCRLFDPSRPLTLLLTESPDAFVDAGSFFSHEFMLQQDPSFCPTAICSGPGHPVSNGETVTWQEMPGATTRPALSPSTAEQMTGDRCGWCSARLRLAPYRY